MLVMKTYISANFTAIIKPPKGTMVRVLVKIVIYTMTYFLRICTYYKVCIVYT